MKKIKKVYLPKWIRWFITPMMILMFAWITQLEFFHPETQGELGVFGYIVISVLLLGTIVMVWLMSSGKLPAYLIEESDDEE